MNRIRSFVETQLGALIGVSFVLGLFIPGLEHAPDWMISILVAAIIFFACFRIDPKHLGEIKPRKLATYYVFRFIVLPVIFFLVADLLTPELSNGILLLSLMPAGVMSPALSALLGGNAAISLSLVIASSLLCPIITPLVFALLGHSNIHIDPWGLFQSLAWVLFLPIAFHIPFRRPSPSRSWINRNNTFATMILLGVAIALVAARQRGIIEEDPATIIFDLLVLSVLFLLLYAIPWILLVRFSRASRIACTMSSGANNSLLGLGVALLHFSPEVVLLLVLSEIPWLSGVSLFQTYLRRHANLDEEVSANHL